MSHTCSKWSKLPPCNSWQHNRVYGEVDWVPVVLMNAHQHLQQMWISFLWSFASAVAFIWPQSPICWPWRGVWALDGRSSCQWRASPKSLPWRSTTLPTLLLMLLTARPSSPPVSWTSLLVPAAGSCFGFVGLFTKELRPVWWEIAVFRQREVCHLQRETRD